MEDFEDFTGRFQRVGKPKKIPGISIFDVHGQLVQANPEGERIAKELFLEKDITQGLAVLCRWAKRHLKNYRKPGDRPISPFTPMLSAMKGSYFFQTYLLIDEKDLMKSHILVVIESLSIREESTLEEVCRQLQLSRRQKDIVGLLANGYTNKEIAQFLSLSHETVKSYLAEVRRKMGVSNRTQILSRIVSLQLVKNH